MVAERMVASHGDHLLEPVLAGGWVVVIVGCHRSRPGLNERLLHTRPPALFLWSHGRRVALLRPDIAGSRLSTLTMQVWPHWPLTGNL